MVERTEDEKNAIALKVVDALGSEALALRRAGGHDKAVKAILDYLMADDVESFVRLYDILRGE